MRKPDKNRVLNAVAHIEAPDIAFMEYNPDIVLVSTIDKDCHGQLHIAAPGASANTSQSVLS